MKTYYVYKLTSPSNKSYIGFTGNSLDIRWRQHVTSWRLGNGCIGQKLSRAFSKYDPSLWTKEILFISDNKEQALAQEDILILEYDTLQNGYNSSRGGGKGNLGLKLTAAHKAKISLSLKGKKKSESHVAKMSINAKRNTKTWTIQTPDGNIIVINNLREFVRKNNLKYNALAETRPGQRLIQHRGYKVLNVY